ncbi:MAG TPA: glycosyltransferase family 2 protein [Roseiflexaceae bacterium]|nr:glycosyltransferase family 2 protein [Roseiflexaceae bacterium]HMP39247.1 glycosyltransferase family 2 protein [Roseiflexaceae bacterium]
MEPTPRTLIIILCYNGIELTLECLRSLQAVEGALFDILVLDNASSDQTPAQIRAHFPHVHVIENGANLGFAAGNNVGLRYALAHGYDYALLLNNDTEVAPDFLARMLACAEADPQIGAVGPLIYYHEQPDLIWSAGGMIDWRRGTSSMAGSNERDCGQFVVQRDVDFVTGCALLVRRAALERAGLLDERFFMYYEETEWCVRIARAGMRITFEPASRLWHKIPLNARFDREYLAYYMTRNRLLFLRATGAALPTWINALLFQDLRTFLSLVLRPKWRGRAGRRGMWHGWRDFWRGRFGALTTRL